MPWDDLRVPITGSYQKINPVTATGLTVAAGARRALITVEGFQVRVRDDGTNPTAANGHLLPAGTKWDYAGDLSAIKFIDTAAGASTVHVSQYR